MTVELDLNKIFNPSATHAFAVQDRILIGTALNGGLTTEKLNELMLANVDRTMDVLADYLIHGGDLRVGTPADHVCRVLTATARGDTQSIAANMIDRGAAFKFLPLMREMKYGFRMHHIGQLLSAEGVIPGFARLGFSREIIEILNVMPSDFLTLPYNSDQFRALEKACPRDQATTLRKILSDLADHQGAYGVPPRPAAPAPAAAS